METLEINEKYIEKKSPILPTFWVRLCYILLFSFFQYAWFLLVYKIVTWLIKLEPVHCSFDLIIGSSEAETE